VTSASRLKDTIWTSATIVTATAIGGGNGQTESSDGIRVVSRSMLRRRLGFRRRAVFKAARRRPTVSHTGSDAMGRRTRRYPVESEFDRLDKDKKGQLDIKELEQSKFRVSHPVNVGK
jgi:hypothetical protein